MDSGIAASTDVKGLGKLLPVAGEDNRRRDKRYFFSSPIDFQDSQGNIYEASILNVANKGLLIECSVDIEIGTELEGQLKSYQYGKVVQAVNVKGKVVRKDKSTEDGYSFGMALSSQEDEWVNFFDLIS